VSGEPFHRLPEHVTVPSVEVADAIVRLDDLAEELRIRSDLSTAAEVEVVLGRMTAWLWPLLRDIDDEGDQ
jgi:hypothetical protein